MKKWIDKAGPRSQVLGLIQGILITTLMFLLAGMNVWAETSGKKATPTPTKKEVPTRTATPGKKELTVSDVAQKVEGAQNSIQDAQMDLEMEMKDSLSGAEQKSRASVSMKSPDKIYAHYTKPEEQFLYVGGSLSQMYQPGQKTVYQQRTGKGKRAEPVYLGVGKQLKKYIGISKVTLCRNNDNEVGLLFIPNDKMTAGFDKMRVYIHKKDWWPYQVEMETPSMNTKAKFSNFSFNKGLKDELFKFTPPKDAQVVDGDIF